MTNVTTQSDFDTTQFGKVAVLCGGHSNERAISLNSGKAVLQALQSQGVDAHHFDPAETDVVELRKFDRVFNVLHGRGGENGDIQGLLNWLKIPYTGSGVFASSIGMDKVRTKQLWQGCGIATAPFMILHQDTDWQNVVDALGLPLMVKPVHEGSSIGMSKVMHLEDLPKAYELAAACDSVVMAEKWITGKEYTVVIIDGEVYPVIRLQPADVHGFYDFDAKYTKKDTFYHIPCGLSTKNELHLQEMSLLAFKALDVSGWGRIDAMQDDEGNFWLLEVNTVPGMTAQSLVPIAARAKGIDFPSLCVKILQQTLV